MTTAPDGTLITSTAQVRACFDKKGEEANICSSIKNTVPISKCDAVLQIALINKDLIVKPLRFGPILVENVETIGQAEKLLLRH